MTAPTPDRDVMERAMVLATQLLIDYDHRRHHQGRGLPGLPNRVRADFDAALLVTTGLLGNPAPEEVAAGVALGTVLHETGVR